MLWHPTVLTDLVKPELFCKHLRDYIINSLIRSVILSFRILQTRPILNRVTCQLSQFFLHFFIVGASWWRVCYQQGLLRLVFQTLLSFQQHFSCFLTKTLLLWFACVLCILYYKLMKTKWTLISIMLCLTRGRLIRVLILQRVFLLKVHFLPLPMPAVHIGCVNSYIHCSPCTMGCVYNYAHFIPAQ